MSTPEAASQSLAVWSALAVVLVQISKKVGSRTRAP